MPDIVPMTQTGYAKLKAELKRMEDEEPKLAARVGEARSEGDLSENAEYHGARETLGMHHARMSELRDRLGRARIIDPSQLPRDEVAFGATVVVKDLEFGDEEKFILVGAGEEDYDEGRILVTSPLAQGLVGKKVGDKVEITVPAGMMRFEVLSIGYDT